MFKKIKSHIYSSAAALTLLFSLLAPAGLASAGNALQQGLCDGATAAIGGEACTGTATGNESALSKVAQNIVRLFSIVVGVISVIFIIYGGFKYITSGGDSNNVSAAKNTLIYALIGLVIVALAQFIVNFVFTTATDVAA